MSDYTPPVSASSMILTPDDVRPEPPPPRPQGFAEPKGGPPPLLGKVPTSAKQLTFQPTYPPTRFTGPVLSGDKDQVVVGSAMLQLPLWIDWTMGNFSLPIQFQRGSMLLWIVQMAYAPFNGSQSTSVALGTNQNGAQIAAADGFDVYHNIKIRQCTGTLPFAIDPNPFQCWITVNQYGATAGSGVVLIGYARI